ncbi:MAG: hypothetical protein ACI97X_000676, partial [Oceanospirillaceae bacterium]
ESYERTLKLLRENKVKLTELANALLEKEVIFKEDLETIFGKRPWLTREEQEDKDQSEKKVVAEAKKAAETPKNGVDTPDSEKEKESESGEGSETGSVTSSIS